MTRPNILYLHSHDSGRFVQPYGHAVPTPAVQSLANDGVTFRQAYCAAPTCSPSRAALLTGEYPHNNGMLGLVHRGFSLYHPEHHIAYTLRRAGYKSAAVGVQHITRRSAPIDYDSLIEADDDLAKNVAPAAARYIKNIGSEPFYLSVGFWETHRKFPAHGPLDDPRFSPVPPTLADSPAIREDFADFKTSLRGLDDGIATVLRALQERGLEDNTLVIFTTDHGPAFPGMKCTLTDHGIGVALIVRGPGGGMSFGSGRGHGRGLRGGRVIDGLVSQLDLYPSICEITGVDPPEWLQGKSFMPLVRGERDEIREEVFAEVNYHAAYEPERAVRTRRYKYIRQYSERARPVPPNTDDSPGKAEWMESGWKDRPVAGERLHDLVFDPNEASNVAEDPAYAAVLEDMRRRLGRWMEETNDPLLSGVLPLPAGVVANDADQLSPNDPSHRIS